MDFIPENYIIGEKNIIPLNNEGYYKFKTEPGEYKLEIYNKDCEKKTKKICLFV